jgi:apolipoprotein N-acyltransferase
VADLARKAGVPLLVGAVSRQGGKDYNGAFLFSKEGVIVGQYLKQHLVPFGEYVPWRGVLGKMVNVLNALGGFEGGREASVLPGPAPLGVSICFEGIFPGLVRRFPLNGAEILANITNDGWYRHTAAPEQHLASNVLRAVENRRWLVRAANTGISAIIDPKGRLSERSGLLEEAVLRGMVTPIRDLTLYSRFGGWFAWLCLLSALGGLLFSVSVGVIAVEKKTVAAMIRLWCRSKHGKGLCPSCAELLSYAHERLDRCVFGESKPSCAKCPVHCYAPSRRDRIRTVMREAGPAMFWRHPWLSLRHFWKEKFDKII